MIPQERKDVNLYLIDLSSAAHIVPITYLLEQASQRAELDHGNLQVFYPGVGILESRHPGIKGGGFLAEFLMGKYKPGVWKDTLVLVTRSGIANNSDGRYC